MQTFQEKMAAAKIVIPPANANANIDDFLFALHVAKGFADARSQLADSAQFKAAILDFEPYWISLIDFAKPAADASALNRPSPVHVLDATGKWALPAPKPPTEIQAAAVPTGELATPPTSIPETIQPAPHAPRRKMAGSF